MTMRRAAAVAATVLAAASLSAQRYTGPDGKLRVALAQQPFSPNGTSPGPRTMANGGIRDHRFQVNEDIGDMNRQNAMRF